MTRVEWNMPAQRREQALFAGFLLAFVFFYFHMVYFPQSEKLATIQKKTDSLQLEKKALVKLIDIPPSKVRPLSRRKDVKMKILSGDIQSTYNNVSLLFTRLTEPAFLGGISIQDLSYAPAVKEKGYERTDFRLKMRGSFSEILHYLEKMEEFPALFSLEGVNIANVEGQPQEIESEMSGHFFRIMKANEIAASTPDAASAGGKP